MITNVPVYDNNGPPTRGGLPPPGGDFFDLASLSHVILLDFDAPTCCSYGRVACAACCITLVRIHAGTRNPLVRHCTHICLSTEELKTLPK